MHPCRLPHALLNRPPPDAPRTRTHMHASSFPPSSSSSSCSTASSPLPPFPTAFVTYPRLPLQTAADPPPTAARLFPYRIGSKLTPPATPPGPLITPTRPARMGTAQLLLPPPLPPARPTTSCDVPQLAYAAAVSPCSATVSLRDWFKVNPQPPSSSSSPLLCQHGRELQAVCVPCGAGLAGAQRRSQRGQRRALARQPLAATHCVKCARGGEQWGVMVHLWLDQER